MEIEEWRKKHSEDTELTIEQVIEQHISELEKEVEYFDKHSQSHVHQDVWLRFLKDILAGKKPKREEWGMI